MSNLEHGRRHEAQSDAEPLHSAERDQQQGRDPADSRLRAAMQQRWIKRKATGAAKSGERAPAAGVEIPTSGGAVLPAEVRQRMEGPLGADLSAVKIHTSGESAHAAAKLGARAFTTGSDVHFGSGEFAPGSKEGDKLLAHELTHVVQGQSSGPQCKSADESEVSEPHDPAEQEADQVAERVTDGLHVGGSAQPARAPTAGISRKIMRSTPEAGGAEAGAHEGDGGGGHAEGGDEEATDSERPGQQGDDVLGDVEGLGRQIDEILQAAGPGSNAEEAFDALLEVYRDARFGQLPSAQAGRVVYNLAGAYQARGETPRARSMYEEALQYELPGALREHTIEHIRQGRGAEGISASGETAPATPEHIAELVERVDGIVHAAASSTPEAMLQEFLEIYRDPGFPSLPPPQRGRVLFDIATQAMSAGQVSEAISHAQEALASGVLDPSQQQRCEELMRQEEGGHGSGPQDAPLAAPDTANDPAAAARASALAERLAGIHHEGSAGAALPALLHIYHDPLFPTLPAAERARAVLDIGISYQNAEEMDQAIAFLTEALNLGGLSGEQHQRGVQALHSARAHHD